VNWTLAALFGKVYRIVIVPNHTHPIGSHLTIFLCLPDYLDGNSPKDQCDYTLSIIVLQTHLICIHAKKKN
jgi:hypothetical protein